MTDVTYNFLVEVTLDGTIRVHPSVPESTDKPARVATPVEIVATALKLAHDLDQQILIERITDTLMHNLVPPVETVPDQVRYALKERGIAPDPSFIESAEQLFEVATEPEV
jgi:hypothetical protein